ncbi:hypothetical protein GQ600_13401 [Phytophthora cactorum]|nr:hypothetical protein GQ600_13401 [Phytophthora cactorum]
MSGAHAAAFGSDAARAIQIRVMAWGSTRGDAPLVVAALETTQDTEQRAALFGARPQRTQRSAHARRQPGEPAVLLAVGTIQASLDDVMFGLTTQTFGTCVSEQDGTVDVYIQVYVETIGHILDTIVMNAMWIAVLGFWEAPRLAEDKKLQWCILNSIKDPTNRQRRVTGTWMDLSLCGVCKDKLRRHSRGRDGLPSANKTCAVCGALLCSKCHIKRSFEQELAWQQNQQRAASDDADHARHGDY